MNRFFKYIACAVVMLTVAGCVDKDPKEETLPSADVAFEYKVIDASYQIDYYVGAQIEFTNTSFLNGDAAWDFGDGTTGSGETVVHKYAEAGTYQVRLTVGGKYLQKPIMISDIKPILSIREMSDEICEVLKTTVLFNMELPNPENLPVEYLWTFPDGTLTAGGDTIFTSTDSVPEAIKFGNVGSQNITLQVTLGGRPLEIGSLNVQVGYDKPVPTLYYAVKGGNLMALKLINDAPEGMKIMPFDLGVSSGQHPLNILFADSSIFVLDCGRQFTYVNDADSVMGDGQLFVVSQDGSSVSTMFTNVGGHAFLDPFFGYIEDKNIYVSDRNTGVAVGSLSTRNKTLNRTDFPYYFKNNTLGYYGNGWTYGSITGGLDKINGTWHISKTMNGTGIFRFLPSDIQKSEVEGGKGTPPAAGIALLGMLPKAFKYDSKNDRFYFTLYDTGYEGIYCCKMAELDGITAKSQLSNYKLTTAEGYSATPITTNGMGEGGSGEFIGICQLALDADDGCVYFGLRSGAPIEVLSGLKRYNPATSNIETVIDGIEVYGVCINPTKSKLF